MGRLDTDKSISSLASTQTASGKRNDEKSGFRVRDRSRESERGGGELSRYRWARSASGDREDGFSGLGGHGGGDRGGYREGDRAGFRNSAATGFCKQGRNSPSELEFVL